MSVVQARPKTPLVTVALLFMGLVAIIGGLSIVFTRGGCPEFTCADRAYGPAILLLIWGPIACAAVIRGRVGFVALLAAILLPLAIAWRYFMSVLVLLVIIMVTARASKDRLAPYYRWYKEAS